MHQKWFFFFFQIVETQKSSDSDKILRAVTVPIVNHKKCYELYKEKGIEFTRRMICAGSDHGDKDSCRKDAGSPLSINKDGVRLLVGVTSFSIGCDQPFYRGVYGRVTSVRSWIKSLSGI